MIMSGGQFDYQQYHMNDIADGILKVIRLNEYGWKNYEE
jgi:hypothetical protein